VRVEVTVALEKIYGEPLPGELLAEGDASRATVDVEEVPNGTKGTDGTNGKHLSLNPSPQSGEGVQP